MFIISITPAGTMTVEPWHGEVKLNDLYERVFPEEMTFVKCTVEAVDLRDASGQVYATLWCDEEGLPNRLEHNPTATAVSIDGGGGAPIVGPVVITAGPDEDGAIHGAPVTVVVRVVDLLARVRATVGV